jgi:hypothetical protein
MSQELIFKKGNAHVVRASGKSYGSTISLANKYSRNMECKALAYWLFMS